ncbi:hypothetical protein C7B77_04775 [Chamaesiphon polymorphus CCALA 037]|uniref:Uncharacterized protein n=1 Tax=Chamaesiphon polymorphus CCALA 037 TaxID=2107692 RepID=A0A2T1GKY4_9CYAN|nr:hypothetical protein C7B77_04775 [Chamaesiphon polymorphus CCALA 037]
MLVELTIAATPESSLNLTYRFPEFILKISSVKSQQFLINSSALDRSIDSIDTSTLAEDRHDRDTPTKLGC